MRSWTPNVGGVISNTSSTGRGTDQKRGPGWLRVWHPQFRSFSPHSTKSPHSSCTTWLGTATVLVTLWQIPARGGGDLSQSHRAPPLPSHSAYSFPHSDCTYLFINYLLIMDSIETLHTRSLSALIVVCPKTVQTPLLILPFRYAWIAPSSAPLCFLPYGFLVCLSYMPTKTVIIKLGVVIVSSIIYILTCILCISMLLSLSSVCASSESSDRHEVVF